MIMVDLEYSGYTVRKAEPAIGIFEPTGQSQMGLLQLIDQKIESLSQSARSGAERFYGWLDSIKSGSSLVLFHGGEIASESNEPLKALVIGKPDTLSTPSLMRMQSEMDFLVVTVKNWEGLLRTAVEESPDGGALRSYLASELLLLANPDFGIRPWGVSRFSAIEFFMQHTFEDLPELIAQDMKPKFADPCDMGPQLKLAGSVANGEFLTIAMKAMERRRVAKPIREDLVCRTHSALSRQLSTL